MMPSFSAFGRRFGVFLLLLLTPLLARADALDGAMLMFEILAVVAGLALFGVVLTLLAYFRPESRVLQLLNGIGFCLSLLLGLLWDQVFNSSTSSNLFGGFNPFLGAAVPLALWLGGVTLARREMRPRRRVVWVAAAVFGAQMLLSPLLRTLLWSVVGPAVFVSGGLSWVWWAISLLLSFAVWWLVLEQAQRHWRLDWHEPRQWLLAPALEAVFSFLLSLTSVFSSLGEGAELASWGQFVATLLGYGMLGWAVGVLAVKLNQQRYAAADVEEPAG
ncbi:hypothetical protein [Hymenobacter persicinus]|uniref:Uncharacterized protein n=1 Tax=Hymenobacter persicinus TaxID=2025506 RepID=A0A4Q5LFP7_9BACT|nr:hypothetical protein [Hymenobacter persicinus]RYU83714.1 hypothetical protein EWM57_01855 [Hymenobacter persicinus]